MLNKDYAGINSRIGLGAIQNATVVGKDRPDLGKALADAYSQYDSYNKQQALTEALKNNDQNAINNAMADINPMAYAQMLKSDAQRAEDRQWALDDMATKHQNAMNLARFNADKSMALAKFKADNNIGSNGLVNIYNNPFDKKRIETRAKNMDENIAKSQSQIDTYNKAEALLNKGTFDTGGISDFLAPITTRFNQDASDFQAEVNKIVPTMRPSGSGSTSDRDMAVFEKATFGFGKPKQTNLNIIKGRRAVEENNIAKEELFAQYITSGMGTPADFDREWRKYLNANPIFGDDKGSTLNENRVDAYTWFSKPQAPSLKNFNQAKEEQSIIDGTVIEDANGNRMILRGGQWQVM